MVGTYSAVVFRWWCWWILGEWLEKEWAFGVGGDFVSCVIRAGSQQMVAARNWHYFRLELQLILHQHQTTRFHRNYCPMSSSMGVSLGCSLAEHSRFADCPWRSRRRRTNNWEGHTDNFLHRRHLIWSGIKCDILQEFLTSDKLHNRDDFPLDLILSSPSVKPVLAPLSFPMKVARLMKSKRQRLWEVIARFQLDTGDRLIPHNQHAEKLPADVVGWPLPGCS